MDRAFRIALGMIVVVGCGSGTQRSGAGGALGGNRGQVSGGASGVAGAGSGGSPAGTGGHAPIGSGGTGISPGSSGGSGVAGSPAQSGGGGGVGAGGGGAGGMAAGFPPSTGDFPFPGRWWAHFPGAVGAGGQAGAGGHGGTVATQGNGFVIHWSANDPTDRGLWTVEARYALNATPAPENGTTLISKSGEMTACWTLFATTDPDALQVQPCGYPPSSGTPALGFFRRGPGQLVGEVPFPVNSGSGPPPLPTSVYLDAFGHDGRTFAFHIASGFYLWRADTGATIDLGPGGGAVFSPDDKRLIFVHLNFDRSNETKAYDVTTSKLVTVSTAMYPVSPTLGAGIAVFSSDGRRAIFYTNADFSNAVADLVAFDFTTGQTIALQPHVLVEPLSRVVAFLHGSDRVMFSLHDVMEPSGVVATERRTTGYDFLSATSHPFGVTDILTAIPGGAFAAFHSDSGDIMLVDAATWTPKVLGSTAPASGSAVDAGLQPSPDGKWLAFRDGAAAFHVWDLAGGVEAVRIADSSGTYQNGAVSAARPSSAYFPADGKTVIHPISPDGILAPAIRLGLVDLKSGQETTLELGADPFSTNWTFSPLGQLAYVSAQPVPAPNVQTGQGPPIALPVPTPASNSSSDPTFSFSNDDRYLFYTANSYLMVRDGQSGTVAQLAKLAGPPFISPSEAVSVAWDAFNSETGALTAYPAVGGSQLLVMSASRPLPSPSNDAITFKMADLGGNGVYFYGFAPPTLPRLIGNGKPLSISDHAIVFQDLDGVCVFSY